MTNDLDLVRQITAWIRELGLSGLLVGILLGNFKGWWVWGRVHREKIKELTDQLARSRQETEDWRGAYMASSPLMKGAVEMMQTLTGRHRE